MHSDDAAAERRERQLARVAAALGDEHFSVDAAPMQKRRGQLGALPRDVRPAAGAGDRVDDDARRVSLTITRVYARTFGVTNQTSVPAAFDDRLATSMRQMPPFLNGSARRAPIRCAASSPRSGSWPTSAMRRRLAAFASCAITVAGGMPGRERVEQLHGRLAVDAGGEQIGGLPRAHERAGEDLVDGRVERLQPADTLP